MNEMVKGISVYDSTEIEGYFGYQRFNELNLNIPVVYTILGNPIPVYAETVRKIVKGVTHKGRNVYFGDVFSIEAKMGKDKVSMYAVILEQDGNPILYPFDNDTTKYQGLDKIELDNCAYIGTIDKVIPIISVSLVSGNKDLLIKTIKYEDTSNDVDVSDNKLEFEEVSEQVTSKSNKTKK